MYKHMGDTLATTKDTSAESHPTAFHSPDPSLSRSPGHCPTPPWKQTISNVHLTERVRGKKRETRNTNSMAFTELDSSTVTRAELIMDISELSKLGKVLIKKQKCETSNW